MMAMSRGTLVAVMALAGAGCNQDSRVPALEAKLGELQAQVEALKTASDSLKGRFEMNETFNTMETVAYLTPGSDGYSVIRTSLGALTVSLKNVQPYANGSKVTLQFGNPTSATIDGLKSKIDWGSVKDGVPINAQAKSRDVDVMQSLAPGAWTSTEVVLEGVAPAALGFVRLRDVSHRGIRMRSVN